MHINQDTVHYFTDTLSAERACGQRGGSRTNRIAEVTCPACRDSRLYTSAVAILSAVPAGDQSAWMAAEAEATDRRLAADPTWRPAWER